MIDCISFRLQHFLVGCLITKHYNLHYYVPNSADLYGSPHGIKVAMFAVDAAMMLGIQATNCIAISVKFDNVAVVQC